MYLNIGIYYADFSSLIPRLYRLEKCEWGQLANLLTLSARGRLYTSEYDVCRRQILTSKDGLRTERIGTFKIAVDP